MMFRTLRLDLFILVAWLLAAPALEACTCAYRGPTCKWFPGSTDPAFVGRVVGMEPRSDEEFRLRIETALRPYVGNAGFVDPRSLQGEALALYISIYRDFWRSIIRPEALDALPSVSNYREFVDWQQRSGVHESRRLVRFAVTEVFAGEVGETMDIYTGLGGAGTCAYSFEVGDEYLVFASRFEDQWTTGTCSGTRERSHAQEDIEYLRGYASAGALGSFTGVVYVRDWLIDQGYAESSMASGAEIEVSHQNRTWKTRTDQNGRFSIGGLQPGQYSISGQYQGQPLSLGPAGIPETEPLQSVPARGCAFVQFSRPEPSGSITGRVFGPTTEALGGISVNAVPTDSKFRSRQSQTDQEGRFEIRELQPGSYVVGINIEGPPTAYRPYASMYYPGVPNRTSAAVLQVSEGAATDVGALRMGRRIRAKKITGKVMDGNNKPLSEVRVSLMLEGFPYGVSDYRTREDGSFELEGLEETPYSARVEMQNPRDGSLIAAETAVPAESNGPVTIVLAVP